MQLKRHPALRPVLRAFARARPKPTQDEERPARLLAHASRADLEHLFGDREWMTQVVQESNGVIGPAVPNQIAEQTRIQFLDSTERAYAHVDKENLTTVDGRRIDEGTPFEDAQSVDPEDYAVLFELDRIRARARGEDEASIAAYDCVLVDEAQELAPLELALIGRAVKPGGTVIVAGDAAQQVDPTSFFAGWESVMEELGARQPEKVVLVINYRCPPDVTALARSVLDARNPLDPNERTITRAQHPSPFHLAVWLSEQLRRIEVEDRTASVTVIARSAESARSFARVLRHGIHLRVSLEGDFAFRAGLAITSVADVKGLEFDYVVVPEASSSTFPETSESRRALYVAVTRATHRLVLASPGPWSPMLQPLRPTKIS
jgi:DNA helicase II / ATP-dependent DNA helicase PcrA